MKNLIEWVVLVIVIIVVGYFFGYILLSDIMGDVSNKKYVKIKEMMKKYDITEDVCNAMKDNKINIFEYQNILNKCYELELKKLSDEINKGENND